MVLLISAPVRRRLGPRPPPYPEPKHITLLSQPVEGAIPNRWRANPEKKRPYGPIAPILTAKTDAVSAPERLVSSRMSGSARASSLVTAHASASDRASRGHETHSWLSNYHQQRTPARMQTRARTRNGGAHATRRRGAHDETSQSAHAHTHTRGDTSRPQPHSPPSHAAGPRLAQAELHAHTLRRVAALSSRRAPRRGRDCTARKYSMSLSRDCVSVCL